MKKYKWLLRILLIGLHILPDPPIVSDETYFYIEQLNKGKLDKKNNIAVDQL